MNTINFKLSALCLCLIFAASLQSQTLAMNNLTSPGTDDPLIVVPSEKMVKTSFIFNVYGDIPEKKPAFEEEHFLGNLISSKWNTFLVNYTQEYETKVGLSNSVIEIQKPVIYNAVTKVNKHLKKITHKGLISESEARQKMGHILDCANVMCFENETREFEQALLECKDPTKIMLLFESVILQKL